MGRSPTETRRSSLPSHLVIPPLFFALAAVVLTRHEMWRDEMQAWGLVLASHSLHELFAYLRYEGHPALWYLLLYGPSRLSANPILMQALHLLIATATVYLLCRFSPFSLLQKVSLAFGYYLLYEYAVISRSYVLGVAGLFAYCAARFRLPRGSPWLAVLLALLFNTNAYVALIAGVLVVLEIVDLYRDPQVGIHERPRRLSWFLIIVVLGGVLAVAQTLPPPDSSPLVLKWNPPAEREDVGAALALLWKGYVPIPRAVLNFWNTNVLDESWLFIGRWRFSPFLLQVVLSMGCVLLGMYLLLPARKWLVVYAMATLVLLVFMHVKYYGGVRHAGHLFVVLLACLWLARTEQPAERDRKHARLPDLALSMLLLAQVPAALIAIRADIAYAFSAAEDVAEYVRAHDLATLPMLGSRHHVTSSVALHLNQPIHYAESDRTTTFIRWIAGRRHLTTAELLAKTDRLSAERQAPVLMITNFELAEHDVGLVKLASFDQQVITDERYHLYLRCPDTLPATMRTRCRHFSSITTRR